MDFRCIVLLLSLWLAPAWADTMTELNDLADKVYQYPSDTLSGLSRLEHDDELQKSSAAAQFRAALLKCEAYVQLGENEAAINLARLNNAKARSDNIPQAGPYFLNCMAAAYINYGDLGQALTLVDTAIFQSRELQQAASLVNGLLLRARISIQMSDKDNALEDLRLAQDIYLDAERQVDWIVPPQAYIQLTMAQLLLLKGELNPAFFLAKHALKHPQVTGKVKLAALLDLAKIAHLNQEFSIRDETLLAAKTLTPELASATELAEYYTQLAEVEFLRDNHKTALQMLNIALNTFKEQKKIHYTQRASRLLAQIYLADNEVESGLSVMQQVIDNARRSNQYDELVACYQILSDYFVAAGDFQQAYRYQLERFNAAKKRDEQLKRTRQEQVKTQLSHYQQRLQNTASQSGSLTNTLNYNTLLLIGLLLLLLIILILFISRPGAKAKLPLREAQLTLSEKMDVLLSTAKQLAFPLTLLQINVAAIPQDDIAQLITDLQSKLRRQDILLHNRGANILIMLPFTSENGATGLINQLEEMLVPLQLSRKLAIGMASMQQHDSLNSLIKRANMDQLSRYNERRITG
ncbi:histidine kinase [Shewanella sp. AS1]|uniref:tetratricopeptide repeat protein n=1 Tax=Shewanella sp. AS1 TaxID=2907626 RepID=UPI001F1EE598|nr:histidine kinase [Shewanella sp. AS1]MCE9680311.1 histidine kinase [Shewanella sp. AS1]